MNGPIVWKLRTALTSLVIVAIIAPACHAGWFWDWLTHKNRKTCTNCAPAGYACGPYGCGAPVGPAPYYTPPRAAGYAPYTTGYVPYTAGYAPFTGTGYASGGYSPYFTTGYAPGYAATGDAYTVGYAPQSYNVAPVGYVGNGVGYSAGGGPVVAYSSGAAPVAGAAGANCPTCGQQTRTVPQPVYRSTVGQTYVTNYQPVASIDPATGSPITVMRACTGTECQLQRTQVYAPWGAPASGCGNGGCGAAVPWTQTPTAYGVTTAPVTSGATTTIVPGSPAPTVRVVPGGESNPSPFRPGFPTNTNEPANQPPSLDPRGLPPSGGASLGVPQWPVSKEWRGEVSSKVEAPTPSREVKLIPVPDPESRENSLAPQAPQLIDPRDKVTQTTAPANRYPVTRVEWPSTTSVSKGSQAVQRIPAIRQDDSDAWRPAPGAQPRR